MHIEPAEPTSAEPTSANTGIAINPLDEMCKIFFSSDLGGGGGGGALFAHTSKATSSQASSVT